MCKQCKSRWDGRLIRICTACHFCLLLLLLLFYFRLKPLSASMETTKYTDGRVDFRNSREKELISQGKWSYTLMEMQLIETEESNQMNLVVANEFPCSSPTAVSSCLSFRINGAFLFRFAHKSSEIRARDEDPLPICNLVASKCIKSPLHMMQFN